MYTHNYHTFKTITIPEVPRYHNWVVGFSNIPVKMGVGETFKSTDICISYIFIQFKRSLLWGVANMMLENIM